MSKNTKIIIGVVMVLLPAVVILAFINMHDMRQRLEHHIEGSFSIVIIDSRHYVSFDDLINMSTREVISSPRGELRTFTGVALADILSFTGASYLEGSSLVFNSIDGFRTAISMADALDTENSFIVFKEDGQLLGERGGHWAEAPFMLVMALDPFPNRWARYVFEIEVQ